MYEHEQIIKNLKSRFAKFQFGDDGGAGIIEYHGNSFCFQYSFGMGWEHVSVSLKKRTPTWAEMCMFKDIFWPDHEACIQYHPARSEYINIHKYCLHIWRPSNGTFPVPPKNMVG